MADLTKPVRLQLSRKKGFNLQALSHATNGLDAIHCARPSKWGNPFHVINEEGWPWITDSRDSLIPVLNPEAARLLNVVDIHWLLVPNALCALFRQQCLDSLPDIGKLRGKNLACWCPLHKPCHVDVLLKLACEAVTPS